MVALTMHLGVSLLTTFSAILKEYKFKRLLLFYRLNLG